MVDHTLSRVQICWVIWVVVPWRRVVARFTQGRKLASVLRPRLRCVAFGRGQVTALRFAQMSSALWRAGGGIFGQHKRERSKCRAGFREIVHNASPCVRGRNASGEMPPVARVFRKSFALFRHPERRTLASSIRSLGSFSTKREFPGVPNRSSARSVRTRHIASFG